MRSPLLALSMTFFLLGISLLIFELSPLRTPISSVAAGHEEVLSVSSQKPQPSESLTPTNTPVPTNTPTPTIFIQPTSTPTPTPTPQTLESTEIKQTGNPSVQEFIMQEINNYRITQGLSKVTTDSQTCSFARIRVEEVSASFNHDGFRSRIDSNSLPYPTYSKVTENIAMNSDYTKVVESWINSSGHAENMRQDTPFVCVEQKGNYFVYVGWRP